MKYKSAQTIHIRVVVMTEWSKALPLLACSMLGNSSWHLPWYPKLVWRTARLIKEGGFADPSMDTMRLKDPLVLFGSEGSALTLLLFLFSLSVIMLCHCSL